ncbi:hypothetical protein JG677_07045 [Campylobacter sp. TTU-622]|uniref:hypothetical protein n=1 Tax=unclassified Campylobacter TaxID=2593542 RepID=UPI001908FFEC|nr:MULTISPECIES: hypothetical protein [unclassified Campylobacter]MBK1971071.1 hypothetical protein [Campylobacter sp. TTU_617]MBK1973799.1 hypothetical protein [Campylobacter sp. TTU-622]MBK1991312.1 hypothetical protein [Campylobacter sp. 2018MI34]
MYKNDKEQEIKDLTYELNVVLEAMLLYAGVKRNKLEEAIEIYIENIDTILEHSTKEGVDEILEVVEYIREHYKQLFI